jgi:hypothetical protein
VFDFANEPDAEVREIWRQTVDEMRSWATAVLSAGLSAPPPERVQPVGEVGLREALTNARNVLHQLRLGRVQAVDLTGCIETCDAALSNPVDSGERADDRTISEPTKRMEKILDAPFTPRDSNAPTSGKRAAATIHASADSMDAYERAAQVADAEAEARREDQKRDPLDNFTRGQLNAALRIAAAIRALAGERG